MYFLGTTISWTKARALALLMIGCLLVASPVLHPAPTCSSPSSIKATAVGLAKDAEDSEQVGLWGFIAGVGAVLLMVTISGGAVVYLERILKREGGESVQLTVWERNFQMAFYSMVFLVMVILWEQMWMAQEPGGGTTPFQGWSTWTVMIVVLQASGGILVAATLKYADAILKIFATSGSIVLSAILGHVFMNSPLDVFIWMGAGCTILAIFNYTLDATPSKG